MLIFNAVRSCSLYVLRFAPRHAPELSDNALRILLRGVSKLKDIPRITASTVWGEFRQQIFLTRSREERKGKRSL
jgi:hypothetical protein